MIKEVDAIVAPPVQQKFDKKLLTFYEPKKWSSSPMSGRFIRHRVKRKGYKWKRYFKYKMYFSSMFKHMGNLRPHESTGFLTLKRYKPLRDGDKS